MSKEKNKPASKTEVRLSHLNYSNSTIAKMQELADRMKIVSPYNPMISGMQRALENIDVHAAERIHDESNLKISEALLSSLTPAGVRNDPTTPIPDYSLSIEHFKKISNKIQLNDLTKVNYLVGKNGQGKSSILAALSYLTTDAVKGINDNKSAAVNHFVEPKTTIEFRLKSKELLCKPEKPLNGQVLLTGNARLCVLHLPPATNEGTGLKGWQLSVQSYTSITREGYDRLNESVKLGEHTPIDAEPEAVVDIWAERPPDKRFVQDGKVLNLAYLSQGVIALDQIRMLLIHAGKQDRMQSPSILDFDEVIVLLEEPENNLHPSLQKKLPQIFDEFIESLPPTIKGKLRLFVSTHSPFVVSAASAFRDQKIYLIEDGALLDNEGSKAHQSSGYTGQECAWIVGRMLGGDISDLGYPLNYCILEEYSLQVILEHCKKKGIIKNFQFVSASGVSRQVSLVATINEISNLSTLVKCNPFYVDRYLVIMDNTTTEDFPIKEKVKIEKIRDKLGGRFIELSESKLEGYYQDFDYEIYTNVIEEIGRASSRDKGIAKEQAAILISQKIKSKSDFTRLFRGELDFLLMP